MNADAVAELLEHQQQIITRQQALALGITRSKIASQLSSGRWRAAFQRDLAVFIVGQGLAPLSDLQQVWAAVLAVGGNVAACRQTAIWLADQQGPVGQIHLATLDGRCTPKVPGVAIHTLPSLGDTIVHPSLEPRRVRYPVAVIHAAHAARNHREAMAVVYRALQSRCTTAEQLSLALAERKRHRHRAMLTAVLEDARAGAQSGMEREHLHCMRRHGLPAGTRQQKATGSVGSRWLDVCVEEDGMDAALVTELDGRVGHDKADEQWRDMDRDNLDEEGGRGHLRYGPAQVFGEGCRVAGQTRRSLVRRGWRGVANRCGPTCVALEPGHPA